MATKALFLRPNVTVLRFVGGVRPRPLLFLRPPAAARTVSYSLSSGYRSLFTAKLSGNASPMHRSFCIRATNDSDNSAPFESPLMQSMEKKIKEELSADSVVVKDAYGDGRHVSIEVISSAFEGKSAVNRQRMVYKAIWEELQNTVHAVDHMSTRTPSEVASGKS